MELFSDLELKSLLAKVFLVSLPQNIAMMIGIYAFNKQKINSKKFLKCTYISLPIIFLIRLLPVQFGVHTILGMVLLIFLSIYILDFPINKTIISVFFTAIIILIVEILNMLVLMLILGADKFKTIMSDSIDNSIAGVPVSVALFIIILILYRIFTKDKINQENIEKENTDIDLL